MTLAEYNYYIISSVIIMPWKLAGPCGSPGCPRRAVHSGYCQAHQHLIPIGHIVQDRPTAVTRGYDYRWQVFRAGYLRRHPTCADCGLPATDVHHLWRLEDGGPQYDVDNLMSLCHACHSARTRVGDIKTL